MSLFYLGAISMGRFVNPDNRAFQAALNSKIYVDKTGLLEYTNSVLNSTNAYICNSRPRRFGKSITANMLTAYYSKACDSSEMFSNLEISNNPDFMEHLNKYDVIHFDVQWCMMAAGGPENIVSYITEQTILELREFYPDEFPEDVNSLPEALSQINNATGNKYVVIIDEWDVLIRDEAQNQQVQDRYIDFLRGMFKGTEPTRFIALAFLTGILPIKKLKTQSALNNFDEFTMLSSGNFAPYIGFTKAEVKALSEKYNQDYEKVKKWYDGYWLNDYQVYNPKAVVSVMLRGEFKSYWSETASYETVVPLINMDFDGLRSAIIEMLSGDSVSVDVTTFQNDMTSFSCRDDVLTYLIHLGYLGYDQTYRKAFVPNEEIRQELSKAVRRKKWNEMIEFTQKSEQILDATLDMEAEIVADSIEKIHSEYSSAIQYNNENSLSSVLTIAYLSTMQYYFKPVRELPTGRGFADFVYIPKPEYRADYPALVVELKWNKNANTALKQIKEKKYPESICSYTGDILIVGINYDKKSKKHECVIERYRKK